jgi:uncharacterized integral membrane protein
MNHIKKLNSIFKNADINVFSNASKDVNNETKTEPKDTFIGQNKDAVDIKSVMEKKVNKPNQGMIKLIIILFLLYILISSNIFTNTVLKLFGNRFVHNNRPTILGTVLQGVFLVIFYILFAHLTKNKII